MWALTESEACGITSSHTAFPEQAVDVLVLRKTAWELTVEVQRQHCLGISVSGGTPSHHGGEAEATGVAGVVQSTAEGAHGAFRSCLRGSGGGELWLEIRLG